MKKFLSSVVTRHKKEEFLNELQAEFDDCGELLEATSRNYALAYRSSDSSKELQYQILDSFFY